MQPFTHINDEGRARMVDVTAKPATARLAVARASVWMQPETLAAIRQGAIAKGDVLAVAQVAGVMGAKQTGQWIPMCHPLPITGVDLHFRLDDELARIEIEAQVQVLGPTGVEMEALTAVTAAALTIYDMAKAIDRGMTIGPAYLVRKEGGKSGVYQHVRAHVTRIAGGDDGLGALLLRAGEVVQLLPAGAQAAVGTPAAWLDRAPAPGTSLSNGPLCLEVIADGRAEVRHAGVLRPGDSLTT
ncbi:MAG: moaC1 [Cyanobacteria bacterium RYN_339]|nr:moaC1 [Cyanobacteria bacterium RYN_339]